MCVCVCVCVCVCLCRGEREIRSLSIPSCSELEVLGLPVVAQRLRTRCCLSENVGLIPSLAQCIMDLVLPQAVA